MSSFQAPGKRVLIVDDEPMYVDVTCEFLKEAGLVASSAGTTTAALESMKKNPADFVLLDINLDKEDGISFLPKLKELYPNVPVVMLTGMGYDNAMIKASLDKGAASYFSKENDLKDLIELLERLNQ